MSHSPGQSPAVAALSNKQFWLEFIEMFKEHPCLWDRHNDDFYNDTLKSLAHGLLLEKMWEVDPNADIDTVKRKISNFRKYYKETKRKNLEKQQTNAPNTWFYTKYLEFLNSQDDCIEIDNNDDGSTDSDTVNVQAISKQKKRRGKVSVTDLAKSMNIETKPNSKYYRKKLPTCNVAVEASLEGNSSKQDDIEQSQDSPPDNVENIMSAGSSQTLVIDTMQTGGTILTNQVLNVDPPAKRLHWNEEPIANRLVWNDEPPAKKLLQEASDITIVETEEEADDDCSTFAAHIKAKLRTFDPKQKCIAQKLISDVMFYASIQELKLTSTIVLDKKT